MAELKLVGLGLRAYGDIIFNTDGAYDIGKSGATRPRDLFLSRNALIGGTLGVTGATTLGVVNGGAASFTTLAASGNLTVGASTFVVTAATGAVAMTGALTGVTTLAVNTDGLVVDSTKRVLIGTAVAGVAIAGDVVIKNTGTLYSANAAGDGVVKMIFVDANNITQVAGASGGAFGSLGVRATAGLPASNAIYAGVITTDGTTARRLVFYDKDGNRAYIDGTSF